MLKLPSFDLVHRVNSKDTHPPVAIIIEEEASNVSRRVHQVNASNTALILLILANS
jgi:hypothetical protein